MPDTSVSHSECLLILLYVTGNAWHFCMSQGMPDTSVCHRECLKCLCHRECLIRLLILISNPSDYYILSYVIEVQPCEWWVCNIPVIYVNNHVLPCNMTENYFCQNPHPAMKTVSVKIPSQTISVFLTICNVRYAVVRAPCMVREKESSISILWKYTFMEQLSDARQ